MSYAVVPVKRLSKGKSRLLPQLERSALESLSIAMLEDILEALTAAPSIDRIAVVTPDPSVVAHAEAAGAIALLRPDPGLNESIDAAAAELDPTGEEPLLVVLGDVAAASPDDIEALFESLADELPHPSVALAPSRDGGTSVLLRSSRNVIPSCFGPDSAKLHREAAAHAGIPCRELQLASLSIDLDRANDVDRFLRLGSGGKRTRQLLAELGWASGGRSSE